MGPPPNGAGRRGEGCASARTPPVPPLRLAYCGVLPGAPETYAFVDESVKPNVKSSSLGSLNSSPDVVMLPEAPPGTKGAALALKDPPGMKGAAAAFGCCFGRNGGELILREHEKKHEHTAKVRYLSRARLSS